MFIYTTLKCFYYTCEIYEATYNSKKLFSFDISILMTKIFISRRVEMIPKPRPLCKKLVRARHNERKLLIAECILYFIFDLRNIRKKWRTVRWLAECTPFDSLRLFHVVAQSVRKLGVSIVALRFVLSRIRKNRMG